MTVRLPAITCYGTRAFARCRGRTVTVTAIARKAVILLIAGVGTETSSDVSFLPGIRLLPNALFEPVAMQNGVFDIATDDHRND
jgi:hypothetical protein